MGGITGTAEREGLGGALAPHFFQLQEKIIMNKKANEELLIKILLI